VQNQEENQKKSCWRDTTHIHIPDLPLKVGLLRLRSRKVWGGERGKVQKGPFPRRLLFTTKSLGRSKRDHKLASAIRKTLLGHKGLAVTSIRVSMKTDSFAFCPILPPCDILCFVQKGVPPFRWVPRLLCSFGATGARCMHVKVKRFDKIMNPGGEGGRGGINRL